MRLNHSHFAVTLALILSGCAGGIQVESQPLPRSTRTVVLFLVDGLGAKILQAGISAGHMPNTRRFFLRNKAAFAQGQAAFPSLTYPNLSSVLTTLPVGDQPIAANRMVIDGKTINYESAFSHPDLERVLDPQTVFEKLNKEGRSSASFSYVLGQNATDHMAVGIREGLEYQNHEYRKLDARLLENMEEYLADKGDPAKWPAFIYVHLVGVDGTAHIYGSRSQQTQEYLAWLDQKLAPVFEQLRAGEKRKQVTTMLTADHGFVDTNRFVNLEKFIRDNNKSIKVTNESRFLGLYLHKGGSREDFETLLGRIRTVPGVELTVTRRENTLDFSTPNQSLAFAYGPAVCGTASYSLAPSVKGNSLAASVFKCPEEFNPAVQPYPFLVAGLSRYLNSANHPDAVVIAKPDTSFTKDHKGNHGGPTADEMLVPILLRNAEMHGEAFPHTSDLLKTLETL
ncbi:MAG: alkaline phosphatase family protein [Bdellovibrionota bacterium]